MLEFVRTSGASSGLLQILSDRVRQARARRGITRKLLAKHSGVSERYLAQIESGQGNISILVLVQIARALHVPVEELVREEPDPPVDLRHSLELLRRLQADELQEARQLLLQRFGGVDGASRRNRIALIGLRGAGKSTLGALLGERLGAPFLELDRLIEQAAGVSIRAIFDLYGQGGFRRLEAQCLEQVLAEHPRFVLSTGGSLVSESATFERLLATCFTVWLRASPAEHMQRVIGQGDMRPMANNREAMADLQRILSSREPLYSKADAIVDTSGHTAEESLETLTEAVEMQNNA